MKPLLKWILPLVVLGVCVALGLFLIRTAPPVEHSTPHLERPVVDILKIQPADYTVVVQSQGTVSPRTQGALVAEVAGRILTVSAHFRPGGFFERGELLATIDPTDYQHALTIARSELAQSHLNWKEEEAKSIQAKRDWKKMALPGPPSELTLRTPQRERAQAALAAAEARLAQAQRELEHTRVVAPYAGRVLTTQVDVGQFVPRAASLATVYAVDYAEVRLPITDRQAAFLTLPESFREDQTLPDGPPVTLSATINGQDHEWPGRVVRTEGSVDPRTRQIYVVAQVDNPYGRGAKGEPPLKVGQFVRAAIQGHILNSVYWVPRSAFRNAEEILTLSADNRVQRRRLTAIWRDADHSVVQEGLQPGDRIVLTPLPYAPNGMQVEDASQPSPKADGGKSDRNPKPEH